MLSRPGGSGRERQGYRIRPYSEMDITAVYETATPDSSSGRDITHENRTKYNIKM